MEAYPQRVRLLKASIRHTLQSTKLHVCMMQSGSSSNTAMATLADFTFIVIPSHDEAVFARCVEQSRISSTDLKVNLFPLLTNVLLLLTSLFNMSPSGLG